MPETMDIYLVQSPDVVPESDRNPDHDSPKDFLRNMLKAYKTGIPVRDVPDFVGRVMLEYFTKGKPVKKMVIGSHGAGLPNGYGHFYIGHEFIADDAKRGTRNSRNSGFSRRSSPAMRTFTSWLARPVTMAPCCGRVSTVLGGVKVHGYTDFVTATNYLLWASVDDETDDGSKEIVCWPSECRDLSYINPQTGDSPRWTVGKPFDPS